MERPEVIISNGNGLQPYETLQDRARAVCYIENVVRDQRSGKERLKRGSGFYSKLTLEGSDVYGVFTNNHVLGSLHEAENANATFCYEGSSNGVKVKLRPELIFKTHKELDFTFVGICKADIDNIQHDLQPIEMEAEPRLSKGDVIIIFQHPKGRAKAYSSEKILHVEKPFVFYKADTETGSSGSPVLTASGLKLIAIHHKGSEELSYNKGTLCSEVLMHLHAGTYTQPSFGFSDSQDKEIYEGAPPAKRAKTTKNVDTSPSEELLDDLSREIAAFWKPLGRKLKIPNENIEEIQADNVQYPSVREKAFQMLMVWFQSGKSVTFTDLSKALKALGKNRIAQKYCYGL